MVFYVAIVALLNLAIGYALARVIGGGNGRPALVVGDSSEFADEEYTT